MSDEQRPFVARTFVEWPARRIHKILRGCERVIVPSSEFSGWKVIYTQESLELRDITIDKIAMNISAVVKSYFHSIRDTKPRKVIPNHLHEVSFCDRKIITKKGVFGISILNIEYVEGYSPGAFFTARMVTLTEKRVLEHSQS